MIKNRIALRIIVKGLINLKYLQKIVPGGISLKFFSNGEKPAFFSPLKLKTVVFELNRYGIKFSFVQCNAKRK